MVAAAAFPVAKLGMLLLKQVSKPIANGLANRAKSSPIFREYVCIPVAQLFHWYDVKFRMKILNLGKVTTIPKLNVEKAIETGSQILSEFIIITFISSAIIYEYWRQSEKEEAKQAVVEKEKAELKERIQSLEFSVEQHSAQVKELTRLSYAIQEQLHKGSIKGLFTKSPSLPKELEVAAGAEPSKVSFEHAHATATGEDVDAVNTLAVVQATTELPVEAPGLVKSSLAYLFEGRSV